MIYCFVFFVQYLGHSLIHHSYLYFSVSYFATLVENMVTWGYVRKESVRGAPYDFRKSPSMYFMYSSPFLRI